MIIGKLTSRQKKIILLIASNSNEKPITTSDIAKELNLSSRTVLREMYGVEKWLYENDFVFIKKPGVGLILDESDENKNYILELLEEEKIDKEYTKDERVIFILSELLYLSEPIKSFYFVKYLKVSETVLNNDLIDANKWISKFNLKIVKKPGIGIYIEGEEKDFREAFVSIIHDLCKDENILEKIKDDEKNKLEARQLYINNRTLNLIDKSILRKIEEIISNQAINLNLVDNAYIGIVVHISFSVQRIINGENITIEEDILKEIMSTKYFKIAHKISSAIENIFDIKFSLDEIAYITMHLKGAKYNTSSIESYVEMKYENIFDVSNKIIDLAQKEFKVYLKSDKILLEDLSNHLGPAMYRLHMGMKIRNPLLDEIKTEYKYFYEGTCNITNELEKYLGLEKILESEIAYLTMHIVAGIERNLSTKNSMNIVISCPNGIGASSILATKIKSYFNNLKIVDTVSAINIDEEKLKNQNVELIISTVELKTSIPYICISPFLKSYDRSIIDSKVRSMIRNKLIDELKNPNEKDFGKSLPVDIDFMFDFMNLAKDIVNLVDDIVLIDDINISNLNDLICICSNIFTKSELEYDEIFKSLEKRINLSSPYIDDVDIMLMHCLSENIDTIKLAMIRSKNDIDLGLENKTKYFLLMLMSKNHNNYQRKALSEISKNLIEDCEFIETLKSKNEISIKNYIKKIVTNFYIKEFNSIKN